MNFDSKIFVAGYRGLVGSAIYRELIRQGYQNIIIAESGELNLCHGDEVAGFFQRESPEYVFLAAARVGGIMANIEKPAEIICENLMIQTNVIDACQYFGVKKLVFLGSSCIYPNNISDRKILPSDMLAGELEPSNRAYAIAKIAGIEMCRAYKKQYGFNSISLMPCNIYGENDNFDYRSSHVVPALIRKFHNAKVNGDKSVVLWGSGKPWRELLHSDDLAKACIIAMERYNGDDVLNVGQGMDIPISEIAQMIACTVGYEGTIEWDATKPDGTYRKLMDSSVINRLGWYPVVSLTEGFEKTYKWFKSVYVGEK